MERYEKYKPSGVEWIGEVPEHWEQCRLKNYCSLKGRIGWNGLRSDEFKIESYAYLVTGQDFEGAVIPWGNCYQIERERYEEDPFIQLKNGDILITKDGTIGKIAKVTNLDKPACLNSGIFVLKQKKAVFDQDYLYWVLVSNMLTDFNNYTSSGTTILHLYQNVFENMPLLVPTFAEQEAIAAYLDARCADIDKVVATQEKRIALLQELKQSEITQAVTRGLNPDARMKDSGVEWIGLVPEHWEVKKLKHIGDIRSGDGISNQEIFDNGTYEVYGGNGLMGYAEKYNVVDDKIVIGRVGALCGNIHVSKGKRFVTDNALIFAITDNSNLDYVAYYMVSADFNKLNTSSAQPLITGTKVMNVKIAIPSLEEQTKIVNYLGRRCGEIDKQIGVVTKQIELLREYKQALITEVVTGKRKV